MRTAAIIQARMGSTRLPGKVLRKLGGRPILGHVIDRLRACSEIDDIAIATSTDEADLAIVGFAMEEGVPVFRGPEDNVLARYAIAVEALDPDVIVRVTGDAPILSSALIDDFLRRMRAADADFLMAEDGVACAQEGVDPLSRRAFDKLLREASDDPVAREHVTGYFKTHPEGIRIVRAQILPACQFRGARLSLDTPADVAFHEAVLARSGGRVPSLEDMILILKREPWLMTLNAHVRQKSAEAASGLVLIRADGGGTLGLGHLSRMRTLGAALRDEMGFGALFLTGVHGAGDAAAATAFLHDGGFPVLAPRTGEDEAAFIARALEQAPARALVCDIRTELSGAALSRASAGVPLVVIDDGSDRRLAADLAVYPPVPQVENLDWTGFKGRRLEGWPYVLLGRRPAVLEPGTAPAIPSRVFLSMGGSDPRQWTRKAVSALRERMNETRIDVVIGAAFKDRECLVAEIAGLLGVTVHVAPRDVLAIARGAGLALVSYGVTAHELAAAGVPALYLCLSADHLASAAAAVDAGFGRIAGGPGPIDWSHVAGLVEAVSRDSALLARMRAAGPAAIDGGGASRLARAIGDLIAADATWPARRAQGQRPLASRPGALAG